MNNKDRLLGESFQQAVARVYSERGYSGENALILMAGLCEEIGEVAHEVLTLSGGFVCKPGRVSGDIEKELFDTLTYLCALANCLGVDLGI